MSVNRSSKGNRRYSSPRRSSGASYKRKKRRTTSWYRTKRIALLVIILCAVLMFIVIIARHNHRAAVSQAPVDIQQMDHTDFGDLSLDVQLLTVNEYSRPGIIRDEVNGIVIHYTANQGSSAQANRDYFEGLKDSHETKASAHFVVGIQGEIIQCIPTNEIAYASNNRNKDTVSIECCYANEDGSFSQETYDEVVHLTAWLCQKFGLSGEDVIRHYDVTGKMCPVYYVEHPDAWDQLKQDVDAYLQEHYS